MKVQEIMTDNVITAAPEEPVAVAAKRMREEEVGCLVVTGNKAVGGIITDRDILGCVAEGHNPQECNLSNHMSRPVVTSRPDEDILSVAQQMSDRRIKRMPLMKNDRLVGLVSFSDIARAMDKQMQNMWSDWVRASALTKAGAYHRRRKSA
jgi:CBS domain-containing protein